MTGGRPSLRGRLKGRPLPSAPHRTITDHEAYPKAEAALADAERRLRRAQLRDDTDEKSAQALADAENAVAEAKVAFEACSVVYTITALKPRLYEELIGQHPPTPEQKAKNDKILFNEDTFIPALIAECVDSDMRAEDWQAFLEDESSLGEGQELINAVFEINTRTRIPAADGIPKGWQQILSSLSN